MRNRPALLVAALVLLHAAANAAVPNRLPNQIPNANRVPLQGNVRPAALQAQDLGPAAPNTPLSITLSFAMAPAQQAALAQLLAQQQNPSSPMYRHWLAPEQFAAQFGLSQHDSAAIAAWLAQQGLAVASISRGGQFISVSGTVAQAQRAFATEIHTLRLDGETHLANISAPQIPAALAGVVASIQGLDDFRPRPRSIVRKAPSPQFTSSVSGNHFLAPGDFHTIYDLNPLLSAGVDGSGITIAVMGQVDPNLGDVASFRSISGLSANTPTVKLYGADPGPPSSKSGAPSTGDLDEAQLDLEWSGAVAPNASILFVNSNSALTSLTDAIDNNLAPILSISYGDCEANYGASLNTFNQLFQQAAAQGQTIVGPAGDSGATDCDGGTNSAGNPISIASSGLAVDFPASSPYVVGAGGTTLAEGSTNYWNSTNGAESGSAISYIPEDVWNDTSAANGLSAGGGGVSAYFAKPLWQTGSGVPSDFARDVPDISLAASPNHDGYLICSESYGSTLQDLGPTCQNGSYRDSSNTLTVVGGTSAAAPSFAGILALVMQKTGARLGNPNPVLYALANGSNYYSIFHDVTVGNNDSPCAKGSTGCPASGVLGYSAGPRYDLATGWGSVDAFNLASMWTTAGALEAGALAVSTTSLSISPVSSTQGATLAFTATVAAGSGSGTPTGTVQFLLNGSAIGSPVALASGVANYTTTSIPAGNQLITAFYSGDSSYSTSKASANITVLSAVNPDFSLSPPTGTLTAAAVGQSTNALPLTFTSVNGLAGTLTISVSTTASPVTPSFTNATFNANAGTWSLPLAANGTATAALSFGTTKALIAKGSSSTASLAPPNPATQRPGISPLGIPGAPALASETWASFAGSPAARRFNTFGSAITGSGLAIAALWMLAIPARRRRWTPLLAFAILAVLGFSAAGCSSGGGGGLASVTSATPTGTFPVTVTATITSGSSTITHTANLTLVVQ